MKMMTLLTTNPCSQPIHFLDFKGAICLKGRNNVRMNGIKKKRRIFSFFIPNITDKLTSQPTRNLAFTNNFFFEYLIDRKLTVLVSKNKCCLNSEIHPLLLDYFF